MSAAANGLARAARDRDSIINRFWWQYLRRQKPGFSSLFKIAYISDLLPESTPWKFLNPTWNKARDYIKSGEKALWKASYKGQQKYYTHPLYDTTLMAFRKRKKRFSAASRLRTFRAKRTQRYRGKRARRRPFRRRRITRRRRGRSFKPVFSLDAQAMRSRRRPRSAVPLRAKVDPHVAPIISREYGNRVLNWPNNTQLVFSHTFLKKAELDSFLAAQSTVNEPQESATLTEYMTMVCMKNMTNNPVEVQLYRYSYKRNCAYSIDDLWDQGLADWSDISDGWVKHEIGMKPQLSERVMRNISLQAPVRYKIGGGGQVSFPMKMFGNRRVSRSIWDQVGDTEYLRGFSYGFLILAQGTLVVDTAGANAGLSSGRLALLWEGHKTMRIALANHRKASFGAKIPVLTGESNMNIDQDTVVQIAKA